MKSIISTNILPVAWRLGLLCVITIAGCGLIDPDSSLPYAWASIGNQYTYNFHPVSDSLFIGWGANRQKIDYTEGALVLEFEDPVVPGDLRFYWKFPKWSEIPGGLGMENELLLRKNDGLYIRSPEDCVFSLISSYIDMQIAPAQPHQGQEMPYYVCGDITTVYRVDTVEQTIDVPAGRFTTFVTADTGRCEKLYWNEKQGLIRIERFDKHGGMLGYYELASKR